MLVTCMFMFEHQWKFVTADKKFQPNFDWSLKGKHMGNSMMLLFKSSVPVNFAIEQVRNKIPGVETDSNYATEK